MLIADDNDDDDDKCGVGFSNDADFVAVSMFAVRSQSMQSLPMQGPKRNQNCVFNEAYRVIEYIFVPRWFIFGIKKAENRSNDGYAL